MKYQIRTEVIGNHVKQTVIYIRETIKDWLYVEVSEGNARPRFYLPIGRFYNKHAYRCVIFPLAPFVLLWLLISRASYALWMDLVEVAGLLKEKTNQ